MEDNQQKNITSCLTMELYYQKTIYLWLSIEEYLEKTYFFPWKYTDRRIFI
jgi:hypothetical protein